MTRDELRAMLEDLVDAATLAQLAWTDGNNRPTPEWGEKQAKLNAQVTAILDAVTPL